MRVSVDRSRRVVRAGLFGFIGDGLAVARPGAGCTVLPNGDLDAAGRDAPTTRGGAALTASDPEAAWPEGNAAVTTAALERILTDDALAGPGARGIVVVHDGRIVAERYAPGFSAATPLLGWSMTKSVVAGLVGLLVKDGRLTLEQTAGWSAANARVRIRIADLLAMSSGLRFNEGYGAVSISRACCTCSLTWRHLRAPSHRCMRRVSSGAIPAAAPISCRASCKTRAPEGWRIRPSACSNPWG